MAHVWSIRTERHALLALLSGIEATPQPTRDLAADLLEHACPRLRSSMASSEDVRRLIEAEAWIDLALWLIGWELPDWGIHHLSCDDTRWNCTICVRGLAINWVEDVAEFQHDNLALAVFGAFVQAQLQKAQGRAPSNIIPFVRMEGTGSGPVTRDAKRP